jgi:large conductance mechanosensitive channel
MLSGFKEFILRGNVVELAVAVVVGTAFTAVVTAVVEGLVNPLIALVAGEPDLSGWTVTIDGTAFLVGSALGAVVNFLLIAATVYFLIVLPMNVLARRRAAGEEEPEAPAEDVLLLQEIRDLLAERRTL